MAYEIDRTIDQIITIIFDGPNSSTVKNPHYAFIPKPYVLHDVYKKETTLVKMDGTIDKINELCNLITEKLRDPENGLENAYIIEFCKEDENYTDKPTACAVDLRSRIESALKNTRIEVTAESWRTSDIFNYNLSEYSNYIILKPTSTTDIFISKMDIKPKHIGKIPIDERKVRPD
jgi:hypothetical protein